MNTNTNELTYPWLTDFYGLPTGWHKTFLPQWVEEVNNFYNTLSPEEKDEFFTLQLKEKWGYFVQYFSFETDELSTIVDKYEALSATVCQVCGAPSTKKSTGWIGYFCDKCVPRYSINLEREENDTN